LSDSWFPAGYSFNLDGTAIYLSIATVVHRAGDETRRLTLPQQLALLAVLLITSKGAAGGWPGSGADCAGSHAFGRAGRIPVAGWVWR